MAARLNACPDTNRHLPARCGSVLVGLPRIGASP